MNMQVINNKAPSSGFRPLTAEEIMAVSGGDNGDEFTADIVVTGHRRRPMLIEGESNFWPLNWFGGGGYDFSGFIFGDGSNIGVNEEEITPHCSNSNYPDGFDHALDDLVDELAARLTDTINALPDVDRREYGAVIWRDGTGNLRTTTIAAGTSNQTPLDTIWTEIDFNGGGQVLAILHSHPTLYNAGSAANPVWLPSSNSGTLSSGDFDHLISAGTGALGGYDSTNYRAYLVNNGALNEYYAFDQDQSMVGAGAQATWAVQSMDTGQSDSHCPNR